MYLSIVLERRRARRSPKRGHGHSLPMLHLAPTVRNNLVAMLGEFVGTFLFLFEKQRSTFLASLGIGIAFFLTELSGVYFTSGSMNPARSLGPAAVNHSFPGYFWIYWVGPGLGSLLACAFYEILSFLHWKDVNVGQDSDGLDVEKRHEPESGTSSAM